MASLISLPAQTNALDAAIRGDYSACTPKPAKYGATRARGFLDCPRTYYWSYVVGYESPASPAQAEGTAVHSVLEQYLRTGVRPLGNSQAERIALSGLEHLPEPKSKGLHVEQDFSVPWQLSSGAQIDVTGQIDFHVEPDGASFLLGDHKTTSDMKWAKTPEDLSVDTQANLYAAILFARYPQAEWANLRWVYYQKRTPHVSRAVVRVLGREQVNKFVNSEIEPALDGMHALITEKPRLADVPANRKHCEAFGGCNLRKLCWSTKAQDNLVTIGLSKSLEPAIKEVGSMGILAKQHSGGNGALAHAQPAPAPAKVDKHSILARAEEIKAKHGYRDVNPPATETTALREEAGGETQQVAEKVEKTKRGRPRKDEKPEGAEQAVAKAAIEIERAFTPPTRVTRTASGSLRAPGYNSEHSYWLLIGATATRGIDTVLDIDTLVGTAQADAAEANQLDHYRKGGSYALLEWAFAKYLEENALKGVVRVPRTLSPAARDVIGLLRAHASTVIEGEGSL